MNKSLWIASELYYPETTSTGYILTKIAEGLTDVISVSVLCGQPSYSARGIRAPSRETYNGVKIIRCWATTLNKDILPLRLINLITITISIFIYALFKINKNDLVLIVTNPPTLPFVIAVACKIRKGKCLLLVHDVYPEAAVVAGKLSANSPLANLLVRLTSLLYRGMEYIFVIGRDMQEKVAGRLAKDKDRVIIATNWADLDLVVPDARRLNNLLKELGLTDKFVVQYAGNIGYLNDIESIVRAALLLKEQKDIHFLFIGSGVKKCQIELAVKENGISNVTILNHRPRNEQSTFLNACDIALISLVNGMKGVSVPSRTYNTLAVGKPIIGIVEDRSELALVIEEERVGWVVPPGMPKKLASVILEAKSQPDLLVQMGARARHAAERKYSFERIKQTYEATIASVLNYGKQSW